MYGVNIAKGDMALDLYILIYSLREGYVPHRYVHFVLEKNPKLNVIRCDLSGDRLQSIPF